MPYGFTCSMWNLKEKKKPKQMNKQNKTETANGCQRGEWWKDG